VNGLAFLGKLLIRAATIGLMLRSPDSQRRMLPCEKCGNGSNW